MIKAVFFDFDGVLTTDKTGSLTTLRHLSQMTGIRIESLCDSFAPYNRDLNLGRTTHEEIWPDLCGALGRQIDMSLLRDAFASTPINREMFELADKLRRHYLVGMITDNKRDRIDHLKILLGLAELFNPIVVSAEIGSSKEHPEIFEYALAQLAIAPHESIFIDNSAENLAVAKALGINTVYFDDARNDLQALCTVLLEKYGLLV